MKDKLEIKLFNTFEIQKNGEPVLTNLSNTRKTKQFVAYLLVNRDRAIPHSELFDLLWFNEESGNPGTALRTLLYRFRSALEKEGIRELVNSIISRRGMYQWNSDLPVEIDIVEFEKYAKVGLNPDSDNAEAKEALKKAIELYTGPLLPDFHTEHWIVSKIVYYRELYVDVIEAYVEILKNEKKYLEIYRLCAQAKEIAGTSELLMLEEEMAKLKMTQSLVNAGESTLLDSGEGLSNLEEYYEQVRKLGMKLREDAERVSQELFQDDSLQNAFVCDYSVFREIYRLQRRVLARDSATMFLALVDVRPVEDTDAASLQVLMNEVIECCAKQLRCGDTLCKRLSSQLAVLFPSESYEDAVKVMERLCHVCKERTGEDIMMVYSLKPLKNARD